MKISSHRDKAKVWQGKNKLELKRGVVGVNKDNFNPRDSQHHCIHSLWSN